MKLHKQMERIYRGIPPENIPWNMPKPPALLVEAVETGKIKPCKGVDLGCGTGSYAVWMAQNGFDMTGIDFSEQAVRLAEELAKSKDVSCRFVAVDLLGDLKEFHGSFGFAYDWELMHHIFPKDRRKYVQNVHHILRPGGKYLSVAFSVKDPEFGGKGKFRKTPLGTTLYFSSEKELLRLYDPLFNVLELTTIEIAGKYGPHMAYIAWLQRK